MLSFLIADIACTVLNISGRHVGASVSSKSTPSIYTQPLDTYLALYLSCFMFCLLHSVLFWRHNFRKSHFNLLATLPISKFHFQQTHSFLAALILTKMFCPSFRKLCDMYLAQKKMFFLLLCVGAVPYLVGTLLLRYPLLTRFLNGDISFFSFAPERSTVFFTG